MITQPEFIRRMKDMQVTGGGGMFGMGNFPEMYNLVINANSDFAAEILKTENTEQKNKKIAYALDLAKLSQNLLKGKELTDFIAKSFKNI
jgi:molecular chaperone HtpG